MAYLATTDAPGNRGFTISTATDWLELRVRRAVDGCALKIWGAVSLAMVLAWVPAITGIPL